MFGLSGFDWIIASIALLLTEIAISCHLRYRPQALKQQDSGH